MKFTYFLAGALVLVSTGCTKQQKNHNDPFFPDSKRSSVRKFERAQTARGARNDGMLYAHHFDGDRLNSLGKQKLSLMLGDDTGLKVMKVYLVTLGEGTLLDQRKSAVTAYLKDGLRPDEKIEFVAGMNPDTLHPSAETISRMSRAETSSEDGSGGSSTGSPSMANAPGSTK